MISILLPNLRVGGAERVNLNLAYEFKRNGYEVEFVLMQANGELLEEAQSEFSVVDLKCSRVRSLPKNLINYFRVNQPNIVIASIWPLTVIASFAKLFCGHQCKLLICEHNNLSMQYKNWGWVHNLVMKISMNLGYRLADARVGVSIGVVNDIAKLSGLKHKMFKVIYNPVQPCSKPSVDALKYAEKLWSCPPGARIVTVGNLTKQKNHDLLLRSFAKLDISEARLMFVGDGELRETIIQRAQELGISNQIIMAGFQSDPIPFYRTANLFVLSSNYEGLPLVIVEALACGTPVVSTDCHSGPAEILVNGQYGRLVPVEDVNALSKAIKTEIQNQTYNIPLIKRAEDFSPKKVASKYLNLLEEKI